MQVSYHKRLNISFIHIIKTGGTSVEKMLRNQTKPSEMDRLLPRRLTDKLMDRLNPTQSRLARLSKHALAIDYLNCAPQKYKDSFSFAIVRNPWDWLVSWYTFVKSVRISPDHGRQWRHALHEQVAPLSFEEYIQWVTVENGFQQLPSRRASAFSSKVPILQSDWLTDLDGNLIVDFVGRFEHLSRDVHHAMKQSPARSHAESSLPHVNKSPRDSYHSYYSNQTRALVEEYFAEDIRRFGYQFT